MNEPVSYSRTILYNEAIAYPGGTWTPRVASALVVTATSADITPEVLMTWLEQSLIPLIGTRAAETLMEIIKASKGREAFIKELTEYRLSIK